MYKAAKARRKTNGNSDCQVQTGGDEGKWKDYRMLGQESDIIRCSFHAVVCQAIRTMIMVISLALITNGVF